MPGVTEKDKGHAELAGTIPLLLRSRCERTPTEVAFYYKALGIYHGVTWERYGQEVEVFCLGLLELGLRRGDRVAIMSSPRPEWLYADLAVLSAGAASVGIHTFSPPPDILTTLEQTKPAVFILEGETFSEPIVSLLDQCPWVHNVILTGPITAAALADTRCIRYCDVLALGRQKRSEEPILFNRLLGEMDERDAACIIFSSGAGQPPQPVVITHGTMLASCLPALTKACPALATEGQRVVAYLSAADPLERYVTIYLPLIHAVVPYLCEKTGHLQESLTEVQPTVFYGLSGIWQKLAERITANTEESSPAKKYCYRWAITSGRSRLRQKEKGGRNDVLTRMLGWFAGQLIVRPLRRHCGFTKLQWAFSCEGPLPASVRELWQIWSVNILNVFSEDGNKAAEVKLS